MKQKKRINIIFGNLFPLAILEKIASYNNKSKKLL